MKKALVALMLSASLGIGLPAYAAEPSLHEVYLAANGGKLDDAQRMMKEVLQAHPNSGKAHFVEAELLVRQGDQKQAASELATAEKLAPGLPFANADAVSRLRNAIGRQAPQAHSATPLQPQHTPGAVGPTSEKPGLPWGMLFIGLGLLAFIAWASKFMSRRSAVGGAGLSSNEYGHQPAYAGGPNGGPGATPAPAAGPGLGSQIMGGLATGAAVGAGVVAGQALMHHFMDDKKTPPGSDHALSNFDDIPDLPSTPLNDFGGDDFGIANSGAWDDGGSSSDSDWT